MLHTVQAKDASAPVEDEGVHAKHRTHIDPDMRVCEMDSRKRGRRSDPNGTTQDSPTSTDRWLPEPAAYRPPRVVP